MRQERKLFSWLEINSVPRAPGIYAWYYRHLLTDHDIDRLTSDLLAAGSDQDRAERLVKEFLSTFLFDVFREEPYQVSMVGPLKPSYQGPVPHLMSITDGLVRRIASDPGRLKDLKKVLEGAVPEFASPIYIGMSDDLRGRVGQHKRLIQKYKAGERFDLGEGLTTEEETADHSFAREVVRRGFSLARLAVAVRVIDAPANIHLDAENILNRINFPLCGRN